MNEKQVVIGIDLGGTKIYTAVVDEQGKILASSRKRTKAEQGPSPVIDRIVEGVEESVAAAGLPAEQIKGVGVGSPGPLDLKTGTILQTPNLGWKNVPLRDLLQKKLQLPVTVDNDGNVGVLGEFAYGAGHGAQHMIGLFIGTGIGGGVIVDGKLLHGFNENAGELGHMILDPNGPRCGCGNKGCLEAFASRLSIEREIKVAALHGVETFVLDDIKENERLRSKKLAEAYAAGDPAVKQAVNRSAEYVGYGTASLLNIFNPEVVVLGGGVVEAIGEDYVEQVRKIALQNVFKVARRNVRIVAALLKDDSAVLGAARLAWDYYNKRKI